MDSKLAKLAKARQKVGALQTELDAYLRRQHNVRVDLIERNPHYQDLQKRLLRAKAIVRSLQRGP